MTKHSIVWLIILLFIFMFAPLMVSKTKYEQCVEMELASASLWYGSGEVDTILTRADSIYDVLMVSTRIAPLITKHGTKPVPESELPAGAHISDDAKSYAANIRDYWGNFLYNIWMFCFRLSHSWAWMVYVVPFLFAIIFDGLMTRKAKLASFKYTSPTVYNLSWHFIIFLFSMALVMFAIAIPLPIFIYPICLTVVGLMLRLLISNIQHSA